MKRVFIAVLICNAVVFWGIGIYVLVAPRQFAQSTLLLRLFVLTGLGVFVGLIYLAAKIFSAGMRSGNSKPHGPQ